ncbi:MAG: hypothetical protein AB7N76_28540 [Planctomycetota bacterium]
MTAAWLRATCQGCGAGIGVRHSHFFANRSEEDAFDSFVGCRICGELRCWACTGGSERCLACDEPWEEDTYPQVWLHAHRSILWVNSWCLACGAPTRRQAGRPEPDQEPDARWYACPSCAAELCEPCARDRRDRCICRTTVMLRGVPRWAAYLPAEVRALHAGLSPATRVEDLRRRRSALVDRYERGELTGLEACNTAYALDGALSELGIEPGPAPWT